MLQRIIMFVALMALALASHASTCPSNNVIDAPPVFQWTAYVDDAGDTYYGGTLEYGEAESLPIGDETLTTRAYRQADGTYSIPGPTLNMKPGNKYVLRYKNLLPYQTPDPDHNVFKDANISNLHTHGLHISGESPGDDVTRFFEGGFGGDFVYDIPADHMGGTFWYHAHHHGSTFLQVSTGGFGLIVIDDSADELPPEVASMTEREMVIGFLDPGNSGVSGDNIVDGTLGATWTVNGAVNGNMCVPANEWQHWRVLLADADSKPKDVSVNGQCEMELMARDGVWRTTAPRTITNNTINLTGASRADIAVRCSGDATISVANNVVANVFADGAAAALASAIMSQDEEHSCVVDECCKCSTRMRLYNASLHRTKCSKLVSINAKLDLIQKGGGSSTSCAADMILFCSIEPFRWRQHGGTGTGKSHAIKTIRE